MEWPLTTVLDDLNSAVMTAALIIVGHQAGYFLGPSTALELGVGLLNFENHNLPGLVPPLQIGLATITSLPT